MVELDLQLSADGRVVVFHDRAIRGAEGSLRPVGELTLAQIKRCRPLWGRPGAERAYEVPTLDEVLAAAPPELPLNLEIKRHDTSGGPAGLLEALAGVLGERRQVLVSSFDVELLVEARRRLPGLPLAPLGGRSARWRELVELARQLDAFSIHLSRRLAAALAREGILERPEAAERPVLAYTVNRVSEARRLLAAGLAGVFTDEPGALRLALDR